MSTNGKASPAKASPLSDLAKQGKDLFNQLNKEKLEEVSDEISTYVKAHPLKSIAMAVGAGFLLGILLKPKN